MSRNVVPQIMMAVAVALSMRTDAADDLVWQLGVRDNSRKEFLSTGRWVPSALTWMPVPCPESSSDRLTFTARLDRLGEFPNPRFPIGLRSPMTILLGVSNGAAKAIVEWNDPAGGPEELEIVFTSVAPSPRDLKITLPGDRIRVLDTKLFPDVLSEEPRHWRLPFIARKGRNRAVIEVVRESPGCDFDMLAVRRIEKAPPKERVLPALSLQAAGDELANIFQQGETVRVTLEAVNVPPNSETQIHWQTRNFFGETVARGVSKTTCSPAGAAEAEVAPKIPGLGFFTFTARLDGHEKSALSMHEAILPLAVFADYSDHRDAKDAHFGTDLLHSNPSFDNEHLARCVRLARIIGSRWERFGGFVMGRLEPEEGKFDWELTDRTLDEFVRQGMDIVGLMWTGFHAWGPPAQWAMDPEKPESKGYRWIPRMDVWEAFMDALVNRYKDRVHTWEILNEPYSNLLHDGEAYGEMLKRAAGVIRRRQPDATIVSGCLQGRTGPSQRKFEDDWFRIAGAESFDVVGVHYASRSRWHEYTATMDAWGIAKPVWDTEGHVFGSGDPYNQAEELVRYYVAKLALGVQRMSHHDWLKLMNWPDRPFTVSPIMAAHRTLAHHLNYAQYIAPLALAADIECHAFRNPDGGTVLVMWNSACAGSQERSAAGEVVAANPTVLPSFSRQVTFPAGDAAPVLIDIMDNEKGLAQRDGMIKVDVDGCPVFVRGIPAATVQRLALISIQPPHMLSEPGGELECVATLRNTTDTALTAKLDIALPSSWKVTMEPTPASLSPGQSANVNFVLKVPADAPSQKHQIPVVVTSENALVNGAGAGMEVLVVSESPLANLLPRDLSADGVREFISPAVDVFGDEMYFVAAAIKRDASTTLEALFTTKDGIALSSASVDSCTGDAGGTVLSGICVAPPDAGKLAVRLESSEPVNVRRARIQLLPDANISPARLRYWAMCPRRTDAKEPEDQILIDRVEQTTGHHQSGHTVDPPFGWRGIEDLSATLTVAYDDDNFYLTAAVTDDSICISEGQPDPIHFWWHPFTDSLQIILDPEEGEEAPYYYVFTISGSRVWRTMFEPGGSLKREQIRDGWVSAAGTPTLVQGEEVTERLSHKVEKTGSGVVYTITLPWKLMKGFRPTPGARIGFNVWIKESDAAGADAQSWVRRGFMAWSPSAYYLLDPSAFGTLEFR